MTQMAEEMKKLTEQLVSVGSVMVLPEKRKWLFL